MSCAGPNKGGEPNDLVQWSCYATVRGVSLTATLDADDKGVFDLQVGVPSETDLAVARQVFGDVTGATPALGDAGADVGAWLRSWDGTDASASFGTPWVHVQRDPGHVHRRDAPALQRVGRPRLDPDAALGVVRHVLAPRSGGGQARSSCPRLRSPDARHYERIVRPA